MNPSADQNQEWDYPPLTLQDFEELYHYYKWDGFTGVSPRGNAFKVNVYFPLDSEESHAKHGFRVKLCIEILGQTVWRYPAISGKTAPQAEMDIKQIIELVETHAK